MGILNMNSERKDQLLGFVIGILANALGIWAYILIFSKYSIKITFLDAFYKGYLGKLILLGALLDLAVFFFFLKREENERARGVLYACIALTVAILILQFT
ncbi:hypothetical protein [Capnocytophaga sp. oral taxon 878]|uniref:hypothetical protein n=1 Tax=Capnocytophaga sp. oral taxon 878 TaxID=1316596 RepID=UPI000D02EF4B|nr:hypothetical protein [Capnocytophaga sp. oral taxon 878]AVM50027.1 hypothetical protein C4H12_05835 [Capnocytophaga sp. oral taxon 878]